MKSFLLSVHFRQIMMSLLLIPTLFLNVSCDKEDSEEFIIWDMAPVEARVIIRDALGVNLLVPDVPGSLYKTDITVLYDGQEYEAQWEPTGESRYLMPEFRGLTYRKVAMIEQGTVTLFPDKNHLAFGEFDGQKTQKIELLLKVDDAHVYTIEIYHTVEWVKREPHISTIQKVNGEVQPDASVIEIVL